MSDDYYDRDAVSATLIKAGTGMDRFVQDAIASDGRGHFIDLYSGEEEEIRVCSDEFEDQQRAGFDFYIYRRF